MRIRLVVLVALVPAAAACGQPSSSTDDRRVAPCGPAAGLDPTHESFDEESVIVADLVTGPGIAIAAFADRPGLPDQRRFSLTLEGSEWPATSGEFCVVAGPGVSGGLDSPNLATVWPLLSAVVDFSEVDSGVDLTVRGAWVTDDESLLREVGPFEYSGGILPIP